MNITHDKLKDCMNGNINGYIQAYYLELQLSYFYGYKHGELNLLSWDMGPL